jgi:prepilin-type N-terminal cleavage/methylation domain-containing protein
MTGETLTVPVAKSRCSLQPPKPLHSWRGFSLVEVVVAVAIFSSAVLGIILMQNSSQRATLNAYYEFLGVSLAREPLELLRGRGFRWLKENIGQLEKFEESLVPEKWFSFPGEGMDYPCEAALFKRRIEIESLKNPNPDALPPGEELDGFSIIVHVMPQNQSSWFSILGSKEEITLGGMVLNDRRDF